MKDPRPIERDAVYTKREAADLLRISLVTMTNLLASGELVGRKIGARDWRIMGVDILAFLESRRATSPTSDQGRLDL